jgi:hypothetical protein
MLLRRRSEILVEIPNLFARDSLLLDHATHGMRPRKTAIGWIVERDVLVRAKLIEKLPGL